MPHLSVFLEFAPEGEVGGATADLMSPVGAELAAICHVSAARQSIHLIGCLVWTVVAAGIPSSVTSPESFD